MIDRGITVIYNDNLETMRKEFKEEFNRIVDQDEYAGLHTFVFCAYEALNVYVEVVYAFLGKDTVVFFYDPIQLNMVLSASFEVSEFKFRNEQNVFLKAISDDLSYIDMVSDNLANCFEMFTLNYEKTETSALRIYEDELFDVSNIKLDESDIVEIAVDYVNEKIAYYEEQVAKAIMTDDIPSNFEDNPFSNEYYTRKDNELSGNDNHEYIPRQDKIRLGDGQV